MEVRIYNLSGYKWLLWAHHTGSPAFTLRPNASLLQRHWNIQFPGKEAQARLSGFESGTWLFFPHYPADSLLPKADSSLTVACETLRAKHKRFWNLHQRDRDPESSSSQTSWSQVPFLLLKIIKDFKSLCVCVCVSFTTIKWELFMQGWFNIHESIHVLHH